MKFFAATALALATAVSAEQCEIAKLTATLLPLITPAGKCQTASGFTIVPPSALPTPEQVKKICSAEECKELISTAKTVTFPTCTFDIGGTPTQIDKLFNSIAGQCGGAAAEGANATAGSNSTAGANATTPATTAPAASSEAPAATTVPPAEETEAGSKTGSGSKGASEDVEAPTSPSATNPAAATPAPTPKSAGVSATLGAAVAVACSIAAFVL